MPKLSMVRAPNVVVPMTSKMLSAVLLDVAPIKTLLAVSVAYSRPLERIQGEALFQLPQPKAVSQLVEEALTYSIQLEEAIR